MSKPPRSTQRVRRSENPRFAAVVMGLIMAATLGWYVVGMPGMDHTTVDTDRLSPVPTSGMDHDDDGMRWTQQTVEEFAESIRYEETLVINVHIPDEGSIPGTDFRIPYDQIGTDSRLPSDALAPIALYCKTGMMSTIAADVLAGAGYKNIIELQGGMDAWEQAGRVIEP